MHSVLRFPVQIDTIEFSRPPIQAPSVDGMYECWESGPDITVVINGLAWGKSDVSHFKTDRDASNAALGEALRNLFVACSR